MRWVKGRYGSDLDLRSGRTVLAALFKAGEGGWHWVTYIYDRGVYRGTADGHETTKQAAKAAAEAAYWASLAEGLVQP